MTEMFHYKSCGLRNVWLRNGFEKKDTAYGEAVAIQDIEGLHKLIGLELVQKKPTLSGAEVRFLRKELDMSQAHLAQILGVSESSLRGWENNRGKITKPAERYLRTLYYSFTHGGEVKELIERISQLNRDVYDRRMEFEKTDEWIAAAA